MWCNTFLTFKISNTFLSCVFLRLTLEFNQCLLPAHKHWSWLTTLICLFVFLFLVWFSISSQLYIIYCITKHMYGCILNWVSFIVLPVLSFAYSQRYSTHKIYSVMSPNLGTRLRYVGGLGGEHGGVHSGGNVGWHVGEHCGGHGGGRFQTSLQMTIPPKSHTWICNYTI